MAGLVRHNSTRVWNTVYAEASGSPHSGAFLRRTAGDVEKSDAVTKEIAETQCRYPQTRQPDRPGMAWCKT